MPNKSYLKGVRFERKVKKFLEEKDYFCIRTAGSHSLIDLIAIKEGNITWLQCKNKDFISLAEKEPLKALKVKFNINIQIVYNDKGKIIFEEL